MLQFWSHHRGHTIWSHHWSHLGHTMSDLVVEVNSKDFKTHWAYTIDEDVDDVNTTPIDGIPMTLAGYDCIMYVGPIEQADESVGHPHRHCMLSYKGPGKRACRKGRARAMIEEFLSKPFEGYLRGIISSADRYIRYAWKSIDPAKTQVERTIKRGIEEVADSGMAVTAKRLKTHLANTAGPYFTQKNKTTIDLMLQEIHLFMPSKKVPFTVLPDSNRQSAIRSFNVMARLLENAIKENGFSSSHTLVHNEDPDAVRALAMALIVLPYVCERWEGGDGLPGIFLYGNASTGKSHLFKSAPCYAKIAQDAQGVSRYKKTGVQSAYLLDDIKASFLDEHTNSGTLRQLILGDSVTVKIMGDIQEVCGFVVATSNETPAYLNVDNPPEGAINWEVQCKAWNRRFITIEMTQAVDLDPILVNWHHSSAKEAAIAMFMMMYEQCTDRMKAQLQPYYDHISNQLDEDWMAPFAAIANEEEEFIEENIPRAQPKDAFEIMMAAPQPPTKKIQTTSPPPPTHPEEDDVPCPDECYCPKCCKPGKFKFVNKC